VVRQIIAVAALWCLTSVASAAQDAGVNAGFEALSQFANDIYVLGEQTGGSPPEWDRAEAELIKKLTVLQGQGRLDLSASGENELTLLAAASLRGYAFAVKWLLDKTAAIETLERPDKNGLAPYQYAVFSQRPTLRACHPVIENPFALVPFLVVLPYMANRYPYPKIMAMLEAAGADLDVSALRRFWLETCSNPDENLRKKIAETTELREALLLATLEVGRQECRDRENEAAAFFEEMFGGDEMSAKQRKEVDAAMATRLAAWDG